MNDPWNIEDHKKRVGEQEEHGIVALCRALRQLYRSDPDFRKQCEREFWGYAEKVREQREPGNQPGS